MLSRYNHCSFESKRANRFKIILDFSPTISKLESNKENLHPGNGKIPPTIKINTEF